ncbi:MAG: ABC transporter permease [Roseitalea sp.]|jgi:peptide/nickel transport system permease protein|nr:ABC transporter permease [Roseitalea sp.]MBO6721209.1 ABC transporter permease [Roseitalea sp.]MBO6744267.1 ABC transporter permease [Roseitalea sp.]
MLYYSVKRFGLALLVAVVVSFLSFQLLFLASDPAIALAGEAATEEDIIAIREFYGFDRPVLVQYIDWLGRFIRGDFGYSYYFNLPVSELILGRLGVTFQLGLVAVLLAIVVAVPLGVAAAIRPNTIIDRTALVISVLGQAMPSFWFALVLIVVFSVNLRWLPASGADSWQHFILPTIVIAYFAMPAIMRLTRGGMIEVLSADYIRTAKAKGLRPFKVLFKHALRNAIIPVVSLAAVQFGFMLSGSIVVETIFAIDGAGQLAWESINRNDLATVQALILLFAMIYVMINFLADLLNAWLDPRVRVA